MLIDVCVHGMMKEYRIFLDNLSFSSFSKLMEAARGANESVQPSTKSWSVQTPRRERGSLLQHLRIQMVLSPLIQRTRPKIGEDPGSSLYCHPSHAILIRLRPPRQMGQISGYHIT